MASSARDAQLSFEALQQDYDRRFKTMVINPADVARARRQKFTLEQNQRRYAEVDHLTDVPWYWVGLMHIREAGEPPNFHAWLHNGDPMFDHNHHPVRTVHIPRGRPINPAISWEEGAADALRQLGIANTDWEWTPARCAWAWEKANGFGYRVYHFMPSPYLWGGTSVQQRGKYSADRLFSPNEMDPQLGTMAVLKLILEEGIKT